MLGCVAPASLSGARCSVVLRCQADNCKAPPECAGHVKTGSTPPPPALGLTAWRYIRATAVGRRNVADIGDSCVLSILPQWHFFHPVSCPRAGEATGASTPLAVSPRAPPRPGPGAKEPWQQACQPAQGQQQNCVLSIRKKESGFCYESVVQPHLAVSPERILSLDY